MIVLLSVITVVYFVCIARLRGDYANTLNKKRQKQSECLGRKIIYTASFSTKSSTLFSASFFVSVILLGMLFIYYLIGKRAVADWLGVEEIMCSFIAVAVWCSCFYIGAMSVLYGWVESIVTKESLVITDEKIMGTSCQVNGLKAEHSDFEINISEITDMINQKQEKSAGIDLSAFCILTNAKRYEFVSMIDESEIRSIISKRM